MSVRNTIRSLTHNTAWLFFCLLVAPVIVYSQPCYPVIDRNPIQDENCLPGTRSWEINYTGTTQPAGNHEIEGYASKTSVNVGEQVRFHIRANPVQTVNFEIYRLGYYNGLGARSVHTGSIADVATKPFPVPSNQTGLAEANWISEATAFWNVPTSATSGFYVVKLTGTTSAGHQSYIPFIVRNDSYESPFLFKIGVTTHPAYNGWPGRLNPGDIASPENGKSFYNQYSGGPTLPGIPTNPPGTRQARKISFNRPYAIISSFGIYDTLGTGFINYEYPMIRWLEKEGYDVTYATDIDAHSDSPTAPNILQPGKHKVLLSVGHDEYWSWEMRDNVERARNHSTQPLNIGFFSGNNVYWQIRFENSSASGTFPANAANRTMTSYKETARHPEYIAAQDPLYQDIDPSNDYLIADLWRRNTIKPPEDELVGVMTIPPEGDDTHPANPYSPTYASGFNKVEFAGTVPVWLVDGTVGQTLENLIGYESDELYRGVTDPYPNHNPTIVVASSSFHAHRDGYGTVLLGTAETTFYTLQSNGAKVFAASGQNWSWGLDDWGADSSIGPVISIRVASMKVDAQTITKNILDCFSVYAPCGS